MVIGGTHLEGSALILEEELPKITQENLISIRNNGLGKAMEVHHVMNKLWPLILQRRDGEE